MRCLGSQGDDQDVSTHLWSTAAALSCLAMLLLLMESGLLLLLCTKQLPDLYNTLRADAE
jgi:hypothetical protein